MRLAMTEKDFLPLLQQAAQVPLSQGIPIPNFPQCTAPVNSASLYPTSKYAVPFAVWHGCCDLSLAKCHG